MESIERLGQILRDEIHFLRPYLTFPHLTLGLFLSLTFYCTYQYFLSPLADLPGPLPAKLGFDTWLITRTFKRDVQWKLRELHDKYVRFLPYPYVKKRLIKE